MLQPSRILLMINIGTLLFNIVVRTSVGILINGMCSLMRVTKPIFETANILSPVFLAYVYSHRGQPYDHNMRCSLN